MKQLGQARALGVAAVALALAACSSPSPPRAPRSPATSATSPSAAISSPPAGGGHGWSTSATALAGGGMAALVAAARKEGTLNVIGIPPSWANYSKIIAGFTRRYGIKVHSASPYGSSQQEISAVGRGAGAAPDVLDVELSVALANTSLFAPYQVSTWPAIPVGQKDPAGRWYQDYGGYMSVGYNSARFGTITSLSQLLGPRFKGTVALSGNPTQAGVALDGVMMANLAQGGQPGNIAGGVDFFRKLRQAGSFSAAQASDATIRSGQTGVVFNWDYLNTARVVGVRGWRVLVPPGGLLGSFYAQAISKSAPHPAAARLWEEFLYSQAADGGQNLWLAGGVRPVEQAAMTTNGTIAASAASALPPVSGVPVFLTPAQESAASAYLARHWASAIR